MSRKKNILYIYVSILFFGSCFLGIGIAQSGDIVVSTIHRPPFVIIEDNNIAGFSIELRKEIATRLDISYTYTTETSFSDMLQSVANKDTDIAVANISITSQREEYLDFTHPIYDSGLHILTRESTAGENNWYSICQSQHCWTLFLGLCVCLAGVILTYVYLRTGLRKSLLSIVFLVGLFVSLFFLNIERNNQHTGTNISWREALQGKTIGAAKDTTMSAFLDSKGISYTPYDDFSDSLDGLYAGDVDAILGDAAVSKYYVEHEGKGKASILGNLFAPDKLAIATQENSFLLEDIDQQLLEIKEDGTYNRLIEKYFGR